MDGGWIWVAESDPTKTELVEFYRTVQLKDNIQSMKIRISADSRYKLYINGKFIEFGPSKGNSKIWYYDEIDVKDYLTIGNNEIRVIVLHYSTEHWKGNCSTFRTETPGLYFEICDFDSIDKVEWKLWKCKRQNKVCLYQENPYFSPLWIYEKNETEKYEQRWDEIIQYKDSHMNYVMQKEQLRKRTIPFMRRYKKKFEEAQNKRVEANSYVQFVLDAKELQTAFLKLEFIGGQNAYVEVLQSESYAGDIVVKENDSYGSLPKKGMRDDSSLKLYGYTDYYQVEGYGKTDKPELYEPFWMRTFRFIQITIRTKDEPLELLNIEYEETGYPINIQTEVTTPDSRMEDIWNISERSLRRCMQETYIDCPFYEQLQYAMDSRSQILYTYAISADSRLALKCMDDFSSAVREDGMINCSYPNYEANVIPGFGIYFIGMVYDYMMYFGEKEQIKKYIPVIDGILEFFHKNTMKNQLVGKVGGLNRPENYWSFIDWAKEWDDTNGVPACTVQGPITMESLLYILGLKYASEIEEYLGGFDRAELYRQRKQCVQKAVRKYCMGEHRMLQDGPGVEEYSQHCQVFGILTDTIGIEEGKEAIMRTLNDSEKYPQCSVAMMFYLFRALEKCGCYEQTYSLWDIWHQMVKNHMTTCAEDTLMSRSDCHAWGALALYELPTAILGVRPGKPGYEEIIVKPNYGTLSEASGKVITAKGMIHVSWKKKNETEIELNVDTSELKDCEVKIWK